MSIWNQALWRKSINDAWMITLGSCLVTFAVGWIFVWLTSMFEMGWLRMVIQGLPSFIEKLSAIPMKDLTTPAGLISVIFVDPPVLFTAIVFAISRGSDVVSGELDRGTMEMLLAQPVRRVSVILMHAIVTGIGAVMIAAALWIGLFVGLKAAPHDTPVDPKLFLLPVLNYIGLIVCIAGISVMVSCFDRYRWRTIGIMGGFMLVQFIVKAVYRSWPHGGFLKYFTIYGPYEPQYYVVSKSEEWLSLAITQNVVLFGLGIVSTIIGAVYFCRRDLPAPL